jgi:hypothetical protein
VQRLKWYFEQYEDGYFTIIDHDGGGRHYVGRFTGSEFPLTEDGNGNWSVQNLIFEEMPTAPMLQYPSDWDHESILFCINNDRGDQKLATNGAWTQAILSAAPSITLGGTARSNLTKTYMTDPGTNTGDWAAYEYRGYGFKLWMVTGPAQGIATVYVDGVMNSTVDCYASTTAATSLVLTVTDLSLDIHRVKVVATNTMNTNSKAVALGWYGLQVMR